MISYQYTISYEIKLLSNIKQKHNEFSVHPDAMTQTVGQK